MAAENSTPASMPMTAPATLYEKIEMAYKVNRETIEKINNVKDDEVLHIAILADKNGVVSSVEKRKVDKQTLMLATRRLCLKPFPQNRIIVAPWNKTDVQLDTIEEYNELFKTVASDVKNTFNAESRDLYLDVIHENICNLQSVIQDYYDTIFPFDMDSTLESLKIIFKELGRGYSIETKKSQPQQKENLRVVPRCCENCGNADFKIIVAFCCTRFLCRKCSCNCTGNYAKKLLGSAEFIMCRVCDTKPCSRACFVCRKLFCYSHKCECK